MQRKKQEDTKYQTQDLMKYFTQQETMEHRILCMVIENGIMSFELSLYLIRYLKTKCLFI
jgi:hypothetical protein